MNPRDAKFNDVADFYPCIWAGDHTHVISSTMFKTNRTRLRSELFAKLQVIKGSPFILLQGNTSTCLESYALGYVFMQEPYFMWAFGFNKPNYIGGINVRTGKSYLFYDRREDMYDVYFGKQKDLGQIKSKYCVDYIMSVEEVFHVLDELGDPVILALPQYSEKLKATISGLENYNFDETILEPSMIDCRVIKIPEEIGIIRYCNELTQDAVKLVMKRCSPGVFEYQSESLFQHYCYFAGGCRYLSRVSSFASGKNTAIIGYGNAENPNTRQMEDGDLCNVDVGCIYNGYCSLNAYVFPVNGKFSGLQKELYNLVLDVRNEALKLLRPGLMWIDFRQTCFWILLNALQRTGLIHGDIHEMLKVQLQDIFMPHAFGDYLGLEARDVGGFKSEAKCLLPGIRFPLFDTKRPMQQGNVFVVKFGCYFIEPMLEDAFKLEGYAKYLNQAKIVEFIPIGGVRIKDNIAITSCGYELLSRGPRTVEEIEKIMGEENPGSRLTKFSSPEELLKFV